MRSGRSSTPRAGGPPRIVRLDEAGADEGERTTSGIDELDAVLGGGLVDGSLVLLGGEPGIGKSTLLLQVADSLGRRGRSVLYVCGEESAAQVGVRAHRIGASSPDVALLCELDISAIERVVHERGADVLVIDSIQTVFDPDLDGAPGSVGQVRACTARLARIAKEQQVTTLIVGHVTKDGAIAGPRVLEHMVDTVLYFEGDRDRVLRVVRAVKNRFGPVSEAGIFEMTASGLVAVASPSSRLLSERARAVPGSVVMAAVEGSRPVLVEIQALVAPTLLPVPRRLATGIDQARLLQVIAVLERRAGRSFASADVLVSVAGGLRIVEPALDLPLALALVSALADMACPADLVAFGEVGLTGHVRAVPHAAARVREAQRFGFSQVVCAAHPDAPLTGAQPVETVAEAIARFF